MFTSCFENTWIANAKRRTDDQPVLRNGEDFYIPVVKNNSIEMVLLFSHPRILN